MSDAPLPTLPSRYEPRALLGRGGMGEVWRVFDRERGEEVALKRCLPPANVDAEAALFAFKQEFFAMAALPHPHLAAAYDFGEAPDGTAFFTAAYVAGEDLNALLPLTEDAVRTWLPGVAAALGFLHARGYLHGDLKPENLRLRADGTAVLLDLGLLERTGRTGGEIRGSLDYLAPEAIRQGTLDARADLYGLGAVLYHALTGQAPFAPAAGLALLHAHLEGRPRPLRELAPAVSPALAEAVGQLLAKDPAARPATAQALLERLGLATDAPGETPRLLASPLVGREVLLAALEHAARAWLVGPAGSGKTRVALAAKARAQLAGVPVLVATGRGVEAAPYRALAPWIEAAVGAAPPSLERLKPILARILPGLGVTPAVPLEGAAERVRLVGSLLTLAEEAFPGPVLWLLDDAQALDAASLDVLEALARTDRPWRVLATSDEPAPAGWEALPLEPLPEADVLALAAQLLGQPEVPAGVTDRLAFITGGWPGAVEAVLAHWIATGALARTGGRWVDGAASAYELPGGMAVLGDARFAALAPATRELASLAALLGTAGDLPLLSGLAGLADAPLFAALAELEEARVLVSEAERFRFVQPARAETLAAAWEPAAARQAHGRAAAWLGARLHDPYEAPLDGALALARHHLASAAPLLGVPWARAAAERALALYAVPPAEDLATRALAVPGLGEADRAALLGTLAYVRRFKGEVEAGLALYDEDLLPLLRTLGGSALVEHLITYGTLLQMRTRYAEARAAFAEAINLADAAEAPLQAIRARLFAGRVAFFAGESKLARTPLVAAVRRARALVAEGELAAEPLLGRALAFLGMLEALAGAEGEAAGLALLGEAIAIDQRVGDLRELHEAYNNQGNVFLGLGRYDEAASVFGRCLALCRQMGSANETIFAHLNLGAARLELGQVAEAGDHARAALALARAQGRTFPEAYALALAGLTDVSRGEPAAGFAGIEAGLASARAINNRYLELNISVYRAQALALLGRWEEARMAVTEARALATATQNQEFEGKLSRTELAASVQLGDPTAGAALARAIELARREKRPALLAHLLKWRATHALQEGDRPIAERHASEAAGYARQLGLEGLISELQLELGHQARQAGRRDQAAANYREALDGAEGRGDQLLAEGARLCLADVTHDAGLRRAASEALNRMAGGLEADERTAFMRDPARQPALAVPAPLGGGVSVERLRHLTDLIARMAGETELFPVMNRALAGLVELAGAERGFVVLYDGFEVKERLFYDGTAGAEALDEEALQDAFSTSVAEQVLWSGEPLFVEDAQAHADLADRASVMALGLRAVVGLPLTIDGRVIGVMLADSRRVQAPWGEAELELALALARAVAMAIAHARQAGADRAALAELQLLHRLGLALAGETDLSKAAGAAIAEALALAGAERGYLLLGTAADALHAAAGFNRAGSPLPDKHPAISASVCSWVLEQREPLALVDVDADEAFAGARSIMALGLRTIHGVPLRHGEQVFGLLYLDSQRMADGEPVPLTTLARLGELLGAFLSRQPAR